VEDHLCQRDLSRGEVEKGRMEEDTEAKEEEDMEGEDQMLALSVERMDTSHSNVLKEEAKETTSEEAIAMEEVLTMEDEEATTMEAETPFFRLCTKQNILSLVDYNHLDCFFIIDFILF